MFERDDRGRESTGEVCDHSLTTYTYMQAREDQNQNKMMKKYVMYIYTETF